MREFTSRSGQTLRLSRQPCVGDKCSIEVQLSEEGKQDGKKDGKPRDRKPLGWPLPAGPVVPSDRAASAPLGSMLSCATPVQSWEVGVEERASTVQACSVQLAAGEAGLLVGIEAGFEHVKRRFEIYAIRKGRLEQLWTREDGSGPRTTQVIGRKVGDVDRFVVVEATTAEPGKPDRVVLFEAVANAAGLLALAPAGGALPVPVVSIGPFASVKVAQQARTDASECLSGTYITPASRVGARAEAGFRLVGFGAEPGLGAAVKRIAGCAPRLQVALGRWRPS